MNMVSSRGGLVDEIKGGEKNPSSYDGITTFSPIKQLNLWGDGSTIWGTLSILNNPLKVWSKKTTKMQYEILFDHVRSSMQIPYVFPYYTLE